MKGSGMKFHVKVWGGLLLFLLSCLSLASAQDKFRLKPGARGKLCLGCHSEFEEKLRKSSVHSPVKGGECSECHNPHASSHGKLLAADGRKVCVICHESIIPDKAVSNHSVVKEGRCNRCHDPHASDVPFNLVKAGKGLCLDCHQDLAKGMERAKFKHSPVERDCLPCHDPHGSSEAKALLKRDLASLCSSCHPMDQPDFLKKHLNYPVGKTDCSSCHEVHGSNREGLLQENLHGPVSNRMCGTCHEASSSSTPFKTKRLGYELCRSCHGNMLRDTFSRSRIHWPLLDREGCLSCHCPHASSQKGLLKDEKKSLCATCHADTVLTQAKLAQREKQEREEARGKVIKGALTHLPIQEGKCDSCHASHGSDGMFLLKGSSVIELCGTCHDWSKHTTHPMGPKVVDPRNRNRSLDCLSCHRAHGTGNRYLILLPTVTELCVQCHKQYKR